MDRRLKARVFKAPASSGQAKTLRSPDDWSVLPPIEADPDLAAEYRRKLDSSNGGLRREPELPEHVEVIAKPKVPTAEFEFSDADGAGDDPAAANNERIRRIMERSARQASLDLGDGIDM
jgi:type IV secretion system protein VirD4